MMKTGFHISATPLVLILALLFPLPVAIGADPEEKPRLPLAMEVFLKKPKKQIYELHIHLTNISEEAVTVDIHDMPWSPPNDSKWLEAVRLDGQDSSIKQLVHRWDIGSQEVKLLPGESIQDTMPLNSRLPTLLEDIENFGVQFRWDCPPTGLNFVCSETSSNTISILKGDTGVPDSYTIDTEQCRALAGEIGLIEIPQGEDVLFLHTKPSLMTDFNKAKTLLRRVNAYVQRCQPTWTNSWAVSFFTDKKFAGFLRDIKGEQYYKAGLWQKANIGQYSSQIRRLYRFPWIKKKSNEVYLSVFK